MNDVRLHETLTTQFLVGLKNIAQKRETFYVEKLL